MFYIDWSNIQTIFYRADGFSFTDNLGSARSVGVELEARARLANGFDVTFGGSILNAELTEDQLGSSSLEGRKGDRLPGVPEVTFGTSATYRHKLDGDKELFVTGGYRYVGSTYNAFPSLRTTAPPGAIVVDRQPAYDIGNLRLGISTDRFTLSVFVENLWDERPVLYVNRVYRDVRYNTLRPRTFGVALQLPFGS